MCNTLVQKTVPASNEPKYNFTIVCVKRMYSSAECGASRKKIHNEITGEVKISNGDLCSPLLCEGKVFMIIGGKTIISAVYHQHNVDKPLSRTLNGINFSSIEREVKYFISIRRVEVYQTFGKETL